MWLRRDGSDISNIQSGFQDHTINNFFQNGDSRLIFLGGNHPMLAIFDGLPYPLPLIFFRHQNDRKGRTLDELSLGHFLFGFGATEKWRNVTSLIIYVLTLTVPFTFLTKTSSSSVLILKVDTFKVVTQSGVLSTCFPSPCVITPETLVW